MAPFEDLYARRCISLVGWFEVGQSSLLGQEIMYKYIQKVRIIRDSFKTTYSQEKSYADNIRRDLEFEVGDHAYLKISPTKGMMRFGRKGKLRPLYVGPY